MSVAIPLVPGRNNYTLIVPISGANYQFSDIHWNFEDSAWYMSLLEEDGTPIIAGIKLVLGAQLGQTSTHPFFKANKLIVSDSSGDQRDAGFEDAGARIELILFIVADELAGAQ